VASWSPVSAPRTLQRRASRRRRIFALLGALLATVLIGFTVWAVFLRDDSSEGTGPHGTKIEIPAGEVFSDTVGDPVPFPEDQRQLLVEQVKNYVETASVHPLRSGRPATGLDRVFDPGAVMSLGGPDGTVMLDQGLPAVTGKLTAIAQPVVIYALADASGTWVMASAQVKLDVTGGVEDGKIRIHREGELLFVPDAGAWKVTAYDMFVERKGPGVGGENKGGTTR
jgi:hypothetical protein